MPYSTERLESCDVCSDPDRLRTVYHMVRCPVLVKWGCTIFDPIDTTQPLWTDWYSVSRLKP